LQHQLQQPVPRLRILATPHRPPAVARGDRPLARLRGRRHHRVSGRHLRPRAREDGQQDHVPHELGRIRDCVHPDAVRGLQVRDRQRRGSAHDGWEGVAVGGAGPGAHPQDGGG
ncbi:hypothetical protein LTR53_019919, partial [Teratosphaeriaceae sp. CCFEE 6253]